MDWKNDLWKKPEGQLLIGMVFYGILVLLLTANLSGHLNNTGRGDWDIFYFYDEVPQITIFQYHQFPFWNPYSSGGMPMLANPQSRFLSPALIFSAIFGVVAGLKMEVIFGLLFGMMGMLFLGRYLKMSWPAVLLPGVIFGLNGSLALHLTEGPSLISVVYFPYIFLFLLKSFENIKYVMLSSFLLGLSFYEGGTYGFVFFSLFLIFYCSLRSFQLRSFKPVLVLLAFFIAVLCWSAPKLLPMIEYGRQHTRPTFIGGYIPLPLLSDVFLHRHQAMTECIVLQFYSNIGWWEVGAYLGLGVTIIYLLSLFCALDQYPLLIAGLICFVISLGNFGPFSLWYILHQFPPFNNMQVSTRMLLMFIFSVSLMCGFALDRFFKNFRLRNVVILMIIVMIAWDLLGVGMSIFSDAIRGQVIYSKGQLSLFHPHLNNFKDFKQTYVPIKEWNKYGAWSALHNSVLLNEGVVNAYEPLPVKNRTIPYSTNHYMGADLCEGVFLDLDLCYKGEYYLTGPGSVKLLRWSPNEIKFLVDTTTENKLVINQNYDKNWKTQEGLNIQSFKGRLSADLNAGQSTVTFKYRPISFMIGCLFFLIAFFTVVFILAKAMVCDIL